MNMDLLTCRREIDRVDRELLSLFAERMELAAQVAAYKQAHGLPVLDSAREREKLDAIRKISPEGLEDYAEALFARLMELSRAYQQRLLEKKET